MDGPHYGTGLQFYIEYQYDAFVEVQNKALQALRKKGSTRVLEKMHGTLGAVALDKYGNLAAATSMGGTENNYPGRIDDYSRPGVGTYAEIKTCAVCTKGDGQFLIVNVSAHEIASFVRNALLDVQKAAFRFFHLDQERDQADRGLIAIDQEGNIAKDFFSDRMHRECPNCNKAKVIWIYRK